jgi:hypothetical protein
MLVLLPKNIFEHCNKVKTLNKKNFLCPANFKTGFCSFLRLCHLIDGSTIYWYRLFSLLKFIANLSSSLNTQLIATTPLHVSQPIR